MSETRSKHWLGIDFSGDHTKWRSSCGTSNVWIAEVEDGEPLVLRSLRRVQALEGDEAPFRRLAALLRAGAFEAAAIDAPFSVPQRYVSTAGSHAELLGRVAALPCGTRAFVDGDAFVRAVSGLAPPLDPKKPLRRTEQFWRDRGVNVRSTLWVTPRGGAPMTASCLSLLHLAQRPIWPWAAGGRGLLVEAFPAAQLQAWRLPHQGYTRDDDAARAVRAKILTALSLRIGVGGWYDILLANADALDAVLCAFAAIAVSEGRLGHGVVSDGGNEGWIAVHRE